MRRGAPLLSSKALIFDKKSNRLICRSQANLHGSWYVHVGLFNLSPRADTPCLRATLAVTLFTFTLAVPADHPAPRSDDCAALPDDAS